MYWTASNNVKAETSSGNLHRAPAVPSNAKTVAATGQKMTANITGLNYECSYNYLAYLKTNTDKIYYGEQQSFTTGKSPTAINEIGQSDDSQKDDAELIYNVNGMRQSHLQRGVNIIRFSNGTTRKVFR